MMGQSFKVEKDCEVGSISSMRLSTAFTHVHPKSATNHECLFALKGSALAKAVRKTLVKLSRGVNFINIFYVRILRQYFGNKITKLKCI